VAVLECVLGILEGSEHPVAVHLKLSQVRFGQLPERVVVPQPAPWRSGLLSPPSRHFLPGPCRTSILYRRRPGGELGGQFGGKDLEEWAKVALDEAMGAQAWLLGRRSYEFFGARWRPRSGALADRLNSLLKYVVSSTLEDPDWNSPPPCAPHQVRRVAALDPTVARKVRTI
jgi:hypothetical protein